MSGAADGKVVYSGEFCDKIVSVYGADDHPISVGDAVRVDGEPGYTVVGFRHTERDRVLLKRGERPQTQFATADRVALDHDWQRSRFTEAMTCSRCGLLPVDGDDMELPCGATPAPTR